MAGAIYNTLTTCTLNGNDIMGQLNLIELGRTRNVIRWVNFSDTAYNQDTDLSQETVHFVGVYTATANQAFDVASDCYEASGAGTAGTLSFKPAATGYVFGAVGKFTDAPVRFGVGAVATMEFTMAVNGTISRTG